MIGVKQQRIDKTLTHWAMVGIKAEYMPPIVRKQSHEFIIKSVCEYFEKLTGYTLF